MRGLCEAHPGQGFFFLKGLSLLKRCKDVSEILKAFTSREVSLQLIRIKLQNYIFPHSILLPALQGSFTAHHSVPILLPVGIVDLQKNSNSARFFSNANLRFISLKCREGREETNLLAEEMEVDSFHNAHLLLSISTHFLQKNCFPYNLIICTKSFCSCFRMGICRRRKSSRIPVVHRCSALTLSCMSIPLAHFRCPASSVPTCMYDSLDHSRLWCSSRNCNCGCRSFHLPCSVLVSPRPRTAETASMH